MTTDANIGVVGAETAVESACQEEYSVASSKKKGMRERLGLHEDRIGPIPGGVAAWVGSAIFWSFLAWLFFG